VVEEDCCATEENWEPVEEAEATWLVADELCGTEEDGRELLWFVEETEDEAPQVQTE